jgi:hypothetical protein
LTVSPDNALLATKPAPAPNANGATTLNTVDAASHAADPELYDDPDVLGVCEQAALTNNVEHISNL